MVGVTWKGRTREVAVHFEDSIDIDAAPSVVWAVWSDVERWPDWTASVTSIQRLDDGPLRTGSAARIKQPRFPLLVWRVVAIDEGQSWTWETRSGGVRTAGSHRVEPLADGSTRAVSAVDVGGPVGPLMGRLTAGITRRYLAMEAAGLKARCERG
jgi:uncharacterized membrane protein